MSCPSCGAIHSLEECAESTAADSVAALASESQSNLLDPNSTRHATEFEDTTAAAQGTSRLIEFPGVTRRALPPWRKELSERVREVQERRAREARIESEAAARLQKESNGAAAPQLELLPQVEPPDVNPIVTAALRRIERAHQVAVNQQTTYRGVGDVEVAHQPERARQELTAAEVTNKTRVAKQRNATNPQVALGLGSATAVATAPLKQQETSTEAAPEPERTPTLAVVQPPVIIAETFVIAEPVVVEGLVTGQEPVVPEQKVLPEKPVPKHILKNDAVLSYLDSVPGVYATPLTASNQAPLVSRIVAGIVDLTCVAVLTLPVAVMLEVQSGAWLDLRIAVIMVGIVAVLMFIYLTVSTALTGRTLGLKLLSLRVIDSRTGLIPTGSQAAGRAVVYVFSLATLGLGFLVAAINPQHKTVHDRLSQTSVVRV